MNTPYTRLEIETVYQARKERLIDPHGSFDSAGRWHPTPDEDAGLTDTIRRPSRTWPYSLLTAARTRKHARRLAEQHPHFFARVLLEAIAAQQPRTPYQLPIAADATDQRRAA